MTLNLENLGRRIIIASTCYYSLDVHIMTDSEYDTACARLVESWDDLSRDIRFGLFSREAIANTGMKCRVTLFTEALLASTLAREGVDRSLIRTQKHKVSRYHGRWVPCTAYELVGKQEALDIHVGELTA